jgi:two-component system response regulator VicR
LKQHILLVEDDIEISQMVRDHLTRDGFEVVQAFDGEQAQRLFAAGPCDLVILDLMLPKLNGMDLLQSIREKSVLPVLIMSAKDSDVDKALGLGFGADDYIAKPFSMIELGARVKSALRRVNQYAGKDAASDVPPKQLLDLVIDIDNYSVNIRGKSIQLTSKEFQILKLFVSNPNRVYTKEQIYHFVWNEDYYGDENVINVHMRRLREKIEDDPSHPKYIKTLWGIGYKAGGE